MYNETIWKTPPVWFEYGNFIKPFSELNDEEKKIAFLDYVDINFDTEFDRYEGCTFKELSRMSYEKIENLFYKSCEGCQIELAEIANLLPQNVSINDITCHVNTKFDEYEPYNTMVHTIFYYEKANENYDEELKKYNELKAVHDIKHQEHKNKLSEHKKNLAKYRKDKKEYDQWRKNRIEELEESGEL